MRPAKKDLTPKNKLLKRLASAQNGAAAGTITMQIVLTGAFADAWRSLREAAEGLGLSDADLFGYMMLGGVLRRTRSLLRLKQKEARS